LRRENFIHIKNCGASINQLEFPVNLAGVGLIGSSQRKLMVKTLLAKVYSCWSLRNASSAVRCVAASLSIFFVAGAASAQIGQTLQQCASRYGAVLDKEPQEWHKFREGPYHLLIHFYKNRADGVQYLNWVGKPKAFTRSEIEDLLKRSSDSRWEVTDDGKGFTAIHMKLDHILIVATDGYLERGIAAKAEAEAEKLKCL
jgi:hypothetical protein